jgi:cytochrome c oxidase subunit 2
MRIRPLNRRPSAILVVVLTFLSIPAVALARDNHNMLHPYSPQARDVAHLWWIFFWILGSVYVLTMVGVIVAIGISIARRNRSSQPELPLRTYLFRPDAEQVREGGMRKSVILATAVSAVVLLALMMTSFVKGNAETDFPIHSNPLIVDVTGHQWWWQFDYVDSIAGNRVSTANELHVPIGRPIILRLKSTDVIHSFWVPNIHGKRDAIPGYTTTLWFSADKAGTYQGTCAEFCGYEHARMGFLLDAESPQQFAAWLEHAKTPAWEPTDSLAQRGKEVFLSMPCANCHTIGGTPAGGHVAPPLTHMASQSTLAAASIPNNTGYLTAWIVDPQSIKPGNHMPQNILSPQDLRALVHYLQGLK